MHQVAERDTGRWTTRSTGTDALISPQIPRLAAFAHDLGNLLQTATAAINIIERGTSTPPRQVGRAIAGARESLSHANELLSRWRRPSLAASATSLAESLAAIETMLGSMLEAGIQLEIVVEEELPPLMCDSVELRNAILNLIFNSRNAIAAQGRIEVRARGARDEGGQAGVEIMVADNGLGMSPATVERAFDPYFTTKCEGLGGIGLPVVKQFVEDGGGHIWIESEPGEGTTVRMRLPAADRDYAEEGGMAL